MMWKAPRLWKGETCFILAGGPSLADVDLSGISGRSVITINDSWRLAPIGTVNYFCDAQWWTSSISCNRRSLDGSRNFHDQIYKGFWVSASPNFRDHPQVRCLRVTGEQGLEIDPTGVRHGSNSGYQAINLAHHFGASRIVLLGYDMKCDGARTHWHENGAHAAAGFSTTLAMSMLPHFETLVGPLADAGIEVLNATPDSALECWPKVGLEEILKEMKK